MSKWLTVSGLVVVIAMVSCAAGSEPVMGTLDEFIDYRPLPAVPTALAEWEQQYGKAVRDRVRHDLGLDLLAEELARPVQAIEIGEPITPGGWHYRVRRMKLIGVHGIEIPANVYEPTRGSPPFPGFAYVTGHINPSKEWPEGQQLCANLAERGIVAVAFEYFGLGERAQGGFGHNVGTFSYTRLTATGMEMSDGITVVNYLLQRGDVDAKRIGFTGWSGGGHMTQWMGTVDDRITLVVPCVGTCDYLTMWMGSSRNECWHMRIPRFQAHIDMGLMFGSMAPRRLRVINEANDATFGQPNGQRLIDRARQVYALHGIEDKCDMRCPNAPHNYDEHKQKVLYEVVNETFFDGQHPLGNKVLSTPEQPAGELRVGVSSTPSFGTVYADRIAKLPPPESLTRPTDADALQQWRSDMRQKLVELLAVDLTPYPSKVVDDGLEESESWLVVTRHLVTTESFGDKALPVHVWQITTLDARPMPKLFVVGRPGAGAYPWPLVNQLATRFSLTFIEPRTNPMPLNRLQMYGIFYDRPVLGMQVQDVIRAVEVLSGGQAHPILGLAEARQPFSHGDAGEIALYAAILSPRISNATVRLSIVSHKSLAQAGAGADASPGGGPGSGSGFASDYATLPGVLEVGDLPHFIAAAMPKPIHLIVPKAADPNTVRDTYKPIDNPHFKISESFDASDLTPVR